MSVEKEQHLYMICQMYLCGFGYTHGKIEEPPFSLFLYAKKLKRENFSIEIEDEHVWCIILSL